MSFNSASFCKASSGPFRIWLYETDDNLASLEANNGTTSDYFKNANVATKEGGALGVRPGDQIWATNSSTKLVTILGVVAAVGPGTNWPNNTGSVTVRANAASML